MMTMTDTAKKTLSVPEAGREYFNLGRNAAYAAASRGDIPTDREAAPGAESGT